jgi:hypothetical protein
VVTTIILKRLDEAPDTSSEVGHLIGSEYSHHPGMVMHGGEGLG